MRHVIVDMGGTPVDSNGATIVDLPVEDGPLPLARARNVGASACDSEVMIFLDVDCLPSPDLVGEYVSGLGRNGGIRSGSVGYLPPSQGIDDWTEETLLGRAHFHPGRPQPGQQPGRVLDHRMFWSLSFAVERRTWEHIGGFDDRFTGYGGEDTDFGMHAAQSGVSLWFDGRAVAFHQHHPVSSPPVEHLDDIVRNARTFYDKWGEWPMVGWLDEFVRLGLVNWSSDGDHLVRIQR